MNKENTRTLFEAFPELYRGRFLDMKENLMCFGFECDDGWFELLYDLSREITEHCAASGDPVPLAVQVKEKFGTLRFYADNTSETVDDIIEKYQEKSGGICEVTGAPGKLCHRRGRLKTLSEEEVRKDGFCPGTKTT